MTDNTYTHIVLYLNIPHINTLMSLLHHHYVTCILREYRHEGTMNPSHSVDLQLDPQESWPAQNHVVPVVRLYQILNFLNLFQY